jgi:hypothetical protein
VMIPPTPSSSNFNYILNEHPTFWDPDRAFAIATNLSFDASPMQIFEAMNMPPPRMFFYFFSMCRVMPSDKTLAYFWNLVQMLNNSFPFMDEDERNFYFQKFYMLAFQCQELLQREALAPPNAEDMNIPKPELVVEFNASDYDTILTALSEFKRKFNERFPRVQMSTPGVLINKRSSRGDFQCFLNSRGEELYGYNLEDFIETVNLRDIRDQKWQRSTGINPSQQLQGGLFS